MQYWQYLQNCAYEAVDLLIKEKDTKAFIIISAGFSEASEEGRKLEKEIAELIEKAGGCLIGPNCIGVVTRTYHGVFTTPVPKLSEKGCDFVSGSGATALFIIESALPKGLKLFKRLFGREQCPDRC